jgi:hypothetical protein
MTVERTTLLTIFAATLLFGQSSVRPVLDKYCVTCHNQRLKAGALLLDTADLAQIPAHPATWEKVVKKLRSGTMPPAGSPRPDLA